MDDDEPLAAVVVGCLAAEEAGLLGDVVGLHALVLGDELVRSDVVGEPETYDLDDGWGQFSELSDTAGGSASS